MDNGTQAVKTVVTDRPAVHRSHFEAILVRLSPVRIAATRAVRVYLMSLLAVLAAQGIGMDFNPANPTPLMTFVGLFLAAAQYALVPAVVAFLWNVLELFFKVDEKAPELRA